MSCIIRFAGQTLVLLAIMLSAVTASRADQSGHDNYQFCFGAVPRVEVVSQVFHSPAPYGPYDGGSSSFANTVYRKYDGIRVREPGCQYFATSAEAEAKRRELIDTITRNGGPQAVYELDWKPDAAPAPQPKPADPAAPATSPAPKPVAASATPKPGPPAASAVKGLFVVCNGIDLLAGKLFFNPPLEVPSGDANAWSASYAKYLLTKYRYDRNIACTKFPTLADAQSYYQETSDGRRSTTDLNGKLVPLVITDWKYP